jgi:transposase-like protein
MKYSEERREAVLRKLLPPENRSLAEVAAEEGISAPTLYAWRKQARAKGRLLPDHGRDPEGWTSRDKFSAVIETAALSEIELAEYCRQRGLYVEQIHRWRSSCEQANARTESASRKESEVLRQERKRIRELERELRRKDAALAETAALLTLRKKAAAIWGEEDA